MHLLLHLHCASIFQFFFFFYFPLCIFSTTFSLVCVFCTTSQNTCVMRLPINSDRINNAYAAHILFRRSFRSSVRPSVREEDKCWCDALHYSACVWNCDLCWFSISPMVPTANANAHSRITFVCVLCGCFGKIVYLMRSSSPVVGLRIYWNLSFLCHFQLKMFGVPMSISMHFAVSIYFIPFSSLSLLSWHHSPLNNTTLYVDFIFIRNLNSSWAAFTFLSLYIPYRLPGDNEFIE